MRCVSEAERERPGRNRESLHNNNNNIIIIISVDDYVGVREVDE